jgi:hypothetical protein
MDKTDNREMGGGAWAILRAVSTRVPSVSVSMVVTGGTRLLPRRKLVATMEAIRP